MHKLNYSGQFYSVQGPLNISRSPQGRPILIQAGSSEAGKEFASLHADAVFTGQATIEDAADFYEDVKGRAKSHGRDPNDILILPGFAPIVGSTISEAEEKYQEIANLVVIEDALNYLGRYFNDLDFSKYELDDPFPDLGNYGRNGWESATDRIKQLAKDENLTLRQMAIRSTTPRPPFLGTPTHIADSMQEWFEAGAADGFMMNNSVLPDGFNEFVDYVLPILKERNLFRADYESNTLHGNLGLEVPKNNFVGPNIKIPKSSVEN